MCVRGVRGVGGLGIGVIVFFSRSAKCKVQSAKCNDSGSLSLSEARACLIAVISSVRFFLVSLGLSLTSSLGTRSGEVSIAASCLRWLSGSEGSSCTLSIPSPLIKLWSSYSVILSLSLVLLLLLFVAVLNGIVWNLNILPWQLVLVLIIEEGRGAVTIQHKVLGRGVPDVKVKKKVLVKINEVLGRGVLNVKVKKKDFMEVNVKPCEDEVESRQVQSVSKEERLSE